VEVTYPRRRFARLVNWQHFGPGGEYVMGLEPISGGMSGYGVPAGLLRPGETRTYDCSLRILTDSEELRRFVRRWG